MVKNLTSYRVIYGDTDQAHVAYYANYLRWFEIGRTEFLRKTGIPYSSVQEKGFHFPVTQVSCRYHRPARYDDQLAIETTLTSLGRVTLTFSYKILREKDETLIATGWTKHACLDREGQVTRISADLDTALKAALFSPTKSK